MHHPLDISQLQLSDLMQNEIKEDFTDRSATHSNSPQVKSDHYNVLESRPKAYSFPSSSILSIPDFGPTSSPSPSRWWQGYQSSWIWQLETLCCFLIIGAMVGTFATISSLDQKPLPQWPKHLSVNTLIAVYGVIIKAAAGFIIAEGISHIKWTNLKQPQTLDRFERHDQASRGPWGALLLLWNDKGRNISSLGAVITILILFLEPFSQQIIGIYDCDQTHHDKIASIPTSNYYFPESYYVAGGTYSTSWDMRNTINRGIFATTKSQVEFSCPSGNCTFPGTYSSLAFCSVCEDVSAKLVPVYNTTSNFTSSGAPRTESYPDINLPGKNIFSNLTLQVENAGSLDYAKNIFTAQSSYQELPGIDLIRTVDTDDYASYRDIKSYSAYSCRISPCVKTLSASIIGNLLDEKVESEDLIARRYDTESYIVADLQCVSDTRKQLLVDMGYNLETTSRWLPYNVTVMFNETLKRVTYVGKCKFDTNEKIERYCQPNPLRFGSTAYKGGEKYDLNDEAAQAVPAECVYNMASMVGLSYHFYDYLFKGQISSVKTTGNKTAIFAEFDAMMAVWKAGSGNGTLEDISGLMRNISDTLTTFIREQKSELNNSILGEVHYNSLCIRIRWAWVTYSGATVFFTLHFFVWLIIKSRMDQSSLRMSGSSTEVQAPFLNFKSNILTLLFHGLDEETRKTMADAGKSNNQNELQRRAKEVKVRLVSTEQGWKLSSA